MDFIEMDRRYAPLYQMVIRLGAQGMSSDESDAEHEPRTFTVRQHGWRSDEVQKWLRFIDSGRKQTTAAGRPVPGNLPRRRIRSRAAPMSSRDAIAGQPKNFYRSAWLDGLTDRQYRLLGVKPPLPMPQVDEPEND